MHSEIPCPIKEDETWSVFSVHLSMPMAATRTKIGHVAAGFQGFQILQKLAEKQQGAPSNNK